MRNSRSQILQNPGAADIKTDRIEELPADCSTRTQPSKPQTRSSKWSPGSKGATSNRPGRRIVGESSRLVAVLKMLAVMCALRWNEMPRMFYLIFIVRGWPEGPCFNFLNLVCAPAARPSEPITTPSGYARPSRFAKESGRTKFEKRRVASTMSHSGFCTRCGSALAATDAFCRRCGTVRYPRFERHPLAATAHRIIRQPHKISGQRRRPRSRPRRWLRWRSSSRVCCWR